MAPLLIAASLVFTPADAAFSYSNAVEIVRDCSPRDAGTVRCGIAAYRILDLASAAGANVRLDRFSDTTPRGVRHFTNLSADFVASPTGDWVVVVSHYDTKPGTGCPGANDGASTSGLLIGLAGALSSRPFDGGNVMLVWTDGEECMEAYSEIDGLHGSRRAAARLRESGRKVRGVVCVDMLGDRDLGISIPGNGTDSLAETALRAAAARGLEGIVARSEIAIKDDHQPFLEQGFPAIDLIDFSYGPGNSWWHTKRDTPDKISTESLHKAGELVAGIITELFNDR